MNQCYLLQPCNSYLSEPGEQTSSPTETLQYFSATVHYGCFKRDPDIPQRCGQAQRLRKRKHSQAVPTFKTAHKYKKPKFSTYPPILENPTTHPCLHGHARSILIVHSVQAGLPCRTGSTLCYHVLPPQSARTYQTRYSRSHEDTTAPKRNSGYQRWGARIYWIRKALG